MKHGATAEYLGIWLFMLALLGGCAGTGTQDDAGSALAYVVEADASSVVRGAAPVFVIDHAESSYNLIGSPQVVAGDGEAGGVAVDPGRPAVYVTSSSFSTNNGTYRNIVYRIHFAETPFEFFPFQIGAGRNVGLLVIVTGNRQGQPLLITTLHTCGCYLAFVPTSFLPAGAYPEGWRTDVRQRVYGRSLPSLLEYEGTDMAKIRIVFRIAGASHRIRDIRLDDGGSLTGVPQRTIPLWPMADLETLSTGDGEAVSFYETSGPRAGYVRNSGKIWERLLISWWALDWRVGEDKRFVPGEKDGPVFYTSLKPWARQESDLRDFGGFLRYWGWKL